MNCKAKKHLIIINSQNLKKLGFNKNKFIGISIG